MWKVYRDGMYLRMAQMCNKWPKMVVSKCVFVYLFFYLVIYLFIYSMAGAHAMRMEHTIP